MVGLTTRDRAMQSALEAVALWVKMHPAESASVRVRQLGADARSLVDRGNGWMRTLTVVALICTTHPTSFSTFARLRLPCRLHA